MLLKPSSVSTSTLRGLTELNGSTDKEYFTEGSLNNRLADLNINTNNRGNLALLHLNIHSIFYKLDRFFLVAYN